MKEQTKPYVERALFVIGERRTGKSSQLRTMFRDRRLGTKGIIPNRSNSPHYCMLSNERWLYVRYSSPHESMKKGKKESLEDFLNNCEEKMRTNKVNVQRWNFAGALQPKATRGMPNAVDTIDGFITRFKPERVRAVLFYPDQAKDVSALKFLDDLQKLLGTEAIITDARNWTGNGLIYADFFDFT